MGKRLAKSTNPRRLAMAVTAAAIPFHQAIQARGTHGRPIHLDRQAQGSQCGAGVTLHLERQIKQLQRYQPCSGWRHWPLPQSVGGSRAVPKMGGIQLRMPARSLKCRARPARIPPPLGRSLHGEVNGSTSHSPMLAASTLRQQPINLGRLPRRQPAPPKTARRGSLLRREAYRFCSN